MKAIVIGTLVLAACGARRAPPAEPSSTTTTSAPVPAERQPAEGPCWRGLAPDREQAPDLTSCLVACDQLGDAIPPNPRCLTARESCRFECANLHGRI
ncbi:MAG: hypothetical protein KF819_02740 [Labilithrix sp.]|nr:hypothetical protein [Labilithrix sp.]